MHKIDGAGHVNNEFVIEDLATNRPPTEITAEWLNTIQNEIANVVLDVPAALEKNNNSQLLAAIPLVVGKALGALATAAGFAFSFGPNGYFKLPTWFGGFMLQWVTATSNANGDLTINWPISFPNQCLGSIASEHNAIGWESTTNFVTVWGITQATTTVSQVTAKVRSVNGATSPIVNKASGIAGRILGWGN